jgi:hypothetical protein
MEERRSDPVRAYYASFHQRELERLRTAEGRLEFALTTRLLHPHLLDTIEGLIHWVDEYGRTVLDKRVTPEEP